MRLWTAPTSASSFPSVPVSAMNTWSRNLNTKTKLALLNNLRKQKGLARGFTLVELMITVAIVGILSAVALPQFLNARNSAAAGAAVGELLGLAKECAVGQASKITAALSSPAGTSVTCDGTASATMTSDAWTAGPVGVTCLDGRSTATSVKAIVTVEAAGSMSCTFA